MPRTREDPSHDPAHPPGVAPGLGPGEATLSVEAAGRILGIGRHAAYRAARSGELPTIRLGQLVRVPVPKLLALLGASPTTDPTEGRPHA